MADEKEKKSYPMLPIASWWELRKKFKLSIPGVVTANYLATVLGGKVESARINVLPYLRQLGIIDDEGKTLERAKLWRDDGHYPEVCKAMLGAVYPAELLHAVPDPDTNRDQAERWFANETGTGAVAARRMASLYALLVEADPSKAPDKDKAKPSKERATRTPRAAPPTPTPSNPVAAHVPAVVPSTIRGEDRPLNGNVQAPGININLQVHISADATPDQIDKIFESMARHIYKRA